MAGSPCAEQHNAAFGRCHIDSYDEFITAGLNKIVDCMQPMVVHVDVETTLKLRLEHIHVGKPTVQAKKSHSRTPKECRESASTYCAPLMLGISWSLNNGPHRRLDAFNICTLPIMVGSCVCTLHQATPEELIKHGEETTEFGGYFIVSGIERVIRLLIQQRRHYVLGLIRSSFCSRGSKFTKYATTIRCVDKCERSSIVRVHYMSDGSASIGLSIGRQEIYFPFVLVLRALTDISDKELKERVYNGILTGGNLETEYATDCLIKIFEASSEAAFHTRVSALEHIGSMFRTFYAEAQYNTCEVGEILLESYFFIHLDENSAKQDLLIFMLNKLLCLVRGGCKDDNPDSLVNQEVLLPGSILQNILQEKLQESLHRVRTELLQLESIKTLTETPDQLESAIIHSIKRADIGRQFEYFLATGNLVSKSGLGLSQSSGFTIVAEKLNYLRYVSHFRSIHRGAYFAELRTTTVRKLLPESWGFLCPVHTPDGSPCGLLTHLSANCSVAMNSPQSNLAKCGVRQIVTDAVSRVCACVKLEDLSCQLHKVVPVILDGVVLGYIPANKVQEAMIVLRTEKVVSNVDSMRALEIVVLPASDMSPVFPCLVMFSSGSRLIRPVFNTDANTVELIGTMEQDCIKISSSDHKLSTDYSHQEIQPSHILSVVASLTPWSDFNQSPRNMYQCQMAKQTMGFPLHTFHNRSDTKLYRLHTPQQPISKTKTYDMYAIDNYPLGTNAVVAVLSHTGYDMEDAMIVNKSAVERGFAHATLYKTERIQLRSNEIFSKQLPDSFVDADGLPKVGQRMTHASATYSAFDCDSKKQRTVRYNGLDDSLVEKVKRFVRSEIGTRANEATITYRYNRNPVIGDKFSSRHGQKGVLSFLWPEEDLPYIERTGIRPDVLINPHAFPSRMTIGMLVESLASKCGALTGKFIDASPFEQSTSTPLDTSGETLRQMGYNYTGSETMINGLTGEKFTVDIYIGLVYYQRLRHMVSDKFQVRSTGPINTLTKQPIKGRKAGGGVRFGEMERDSLLAHGAAALLRDRLHLSSDADFSAVCATCGSLISVITRCSTNELPTVAPVGMRCQVCKAGTKIDVVAIPYVFKYLAAELAAMNIRLNMHTLPI